MKQNYLKQLCPVCFEIADYKPNPQRIYDCKCGVRITESRLITAVDTDLMAEDMKKMLETAGRLPSIRFLQEEHKIRLENPLS